MVHGTIPEGFQHIGLEEPLLTTRSIW